MGNLSERLALGEPAAFAELYDACADRLFAYLAARLRSRFDAEDVLQETFVRVARGGKKLRGVDNLVAYVFTIARNEAARLVKHRPSAREDCHDSSQIVELLDDETCNELELRERAVVVAAALARLPPEQQEIVQLKFYSALTLREIAAITNSPPGTVATRYRTALGSLREWLKSTCHDG